jgi:hypothetical protein
MPKRQLVTSSASLPKRCSGVALAGPIRGEWRRTTTDASASASSAKAAMPGSDGSKWMTLHAERWREERDLRNPTKNVLVPWCGQKKG